MNGRFQFSIPGSADATIENHGTITIAEGGLAPHVVNSGIIQARLGKVALAAGDRFTLDLYEDRLIHLAVDERLASSALVQTGRISADGGTVLLTAAAAREVVDHVINLEGVVEARVAERRDGQIVLHGGDGNAVRIAGTMDVSGIETGDTGGEIIVSGQDVVLDDGSRLLASGDTGGGMIHVGASTQEKAENIRVAPGARLHADALVFGDGGEVVLLAERDMRFEGSITARGGVDAGNGGFVEISGKEHLGFAGHVDTTAPRGSTGILLLDPNVAIISNAPDSGPDDEPEYINTITLVSNLDNNNVIVQADQRIDVNDDVDARVNTNSNDLTLDASRVDLNASIYLKSGATLLGTADTVNVNGPAASIQNAVDVSADGGAVVSMLNRSYDLGSSQWRIHKEGLRIVGESESGVIIDARNVPQSAGAGVMVHGEGVTLENMTILGPTANTYGLKLRPLTETDGVDHTLRNVTVQGSGRSEIDLLGVNGSLLENVTARGQDTAGVGVSIADSNYITLDGITTSGNQWGGVALFTAGRFADGGTRNVNLIGTNSLSEPNPLYAEEENGFPVTDLTLTGFDHTVRNSTFRTDASEFTFFQRNEADAIKYALDFSTPGDSVVRNNASGGAYLTVEADGNFIVGVAGGQFMSIQAAVNAASPDDTIQIRPGTYTENVIVGTPDLSVEADTGATLSVSGAAIPVVGETYTGFQISADGFSLSGIEIVGPFDTPYTEVDWATIGNVFGVSIDPNIESVHLTGNTIYNTRTGVSFLSNSQGQADNNIIDNTKGSFLIRSDRISLSGNSFGATGNEWDIVYLNGVSDGAYFTSPIGPSGNEVQYGADMMTLSALNNGMHILDRRYGPGGLIADTPLIGNRSHLVVEASSTATPADDFGLGNGLGNARQPLKSIQAGITGVVHGGALPSGPACTPKRFSWIVRSGYPWRVAR